MKLWKWVCRDCKKEYSLSSEKVNNGKLNVCGFPLKTCPCGGIVDLKLVQPK